MSTSTIIPPQAVLFDLDGTLIDTRDLILGSFQHAFTEVLGSSPQDEKLLDLIGIPLETQMRMLAPDHVQELLLAFRAHTKEVHDRQVKGFEGMEEALQTLRVAGLRLAVVTSKLHDMALRGLSLFGLQQYLEFLIGADDCPIHKPEPGGLLLAAKRMGLPPQSCVYLGDSPYDMQAARKADMLAVGASWGMFTEQRLLDGGAQILVERPLDLPAILGV